MPSKRQPSKQRRAAQNRARAEALAARREAASQPARSSASSDPSSSSGASGATGRRPGLLSGLLGGGTAGGARTATTGGGRRPERTAILVALAFAVASFLVFLFTKVPVDDRDEPLPSNAGGLGFQAVYLEARSILTGEEVTARNVSVIEAHGPAVIIYGLVPLAIVVAVFVAYRRAPSSRPLTIGMLALAVMVLFTGGLTWFPSLFALAVGSFLARRAELPARLAERERALQERQRDRGEDDEDEEYDEYDDEELGDQDLDEHADEARAHEGEGEDDEELGEHPGDEDAPRDEDLDAAGRADDQGDEEVPPNGDAGDEEARSGQRRARSRRK